jgi:hypothetical protein
MESFLDRHNFSFRKLVTKMNKHAVTESSLDVIQNYHISLQVKQLSEICDPMYGFMSLYYIYSHEHGPLGLAACKENSTLINQPNLLMNWNQKCLPWTWCPFIMKLV